MRFSWYFNLYKKGGGGKECIKTYTALSHFNLEARHGAHDRTTLDRFCRASGADAAAVSLPFEGVSLWLTRNSFILFGS